VRGIVTRDLNGGMKPLSHTLVKQEQDVLNPSGVNVIRDFRTDGRDIRLWGARTMTSDAMWKYINVRRLFIFIEQSIDRGTQWAVFEPNSEITWIALRSAISNFLRTVWRNGALMGTTQEEAFFVKCDRTTMTQDDFDNGRLICLIGIAPVKPAEFVIMRIAQKTIDADT
jgi:phage tail sheath protein FI